LTIDITTTKINTNSKLYPIYKKVEDNIRITKDDALTLFNSSDIIEIGTIANSIKNKRHRNKVFFILNGHINYSNICSNTCSFCSFKKNKGDHDSYEMSIEDIKNKFIAFNNKGVKEIHIVGGIHPELPFSYYKDMIKSIKSINSDVNIKAFTAVEIYHFSKLFSMPIKQILVELINSGLNALAGGGAEIFEPKIRNKICPDKISGIEWLNVHKIAHSLNIKSNSTMLIGHIESYRDRIDHLDQLRELQSKTNRFLSFIPLVYHNKNNTLSSTKTTGIDILKTIAISRIFLDNINHIKAYWVMLGLKMAQLSLNFGADDLDGTILEEKITHAAGSDSPYMLNKHELISLIKESGKIPVERDSFYNEM
jgi:aminodeoxyfutalosine synthase